MYEATLFVSSSDLQLALTYDHISRDGRQFLLLRDLQVRPPEGRPPRGPLLPPGNPHPPLHPRGDLHQEGIPGGEGLVPSLPDLIPSFPFGSGN